MAGYGNRTAADYVADDYTDQHSSTRLGLTLSDTPYSNAHEKHGSGTTGGAGFGTSGQPINLVCPLPMTTHLFHPRLSLPSTTPTPTNKMDIGNKRSSFPATSSTLESVDFKSANETGPYSNATPMGSGSTAGAGYGNKTGSFEGSKDSALGRVMERVGHVMHNEGIAEKGRVKRSEKGFGAVE
ncbi:hypothetical protein IAQ61_007249 [Plenodomus lingam]|uniref:uncharacterized protein n=1 Tax=Leptosphaeria maculans TaxID=5022 RepID=UPI00332FBDFB|nr:hypothetical protein IAQ61_007249 [Plenodomus lingam]